MKHLALWSPVTTALLAIVALCAIGVARVPAAPVPASDARVSVTYVNPEKFAENRFFGMQDRFNHIDYLTQLKAHLIKRGETTLKPGQRLQVNIIDIQLAGAYEPGRGPQSDHVRMMREIYPPRIDLNFKLSDQDGKVVREGERVLRDLNYLQSGLSTPGARGESLYYEKALLDRWLRGGPEKL